MKNLPSVLTREQALELGLAKYFTGLPCKHGHVCERRTSDRSCMICNAVRSKRWVNSSADRLQKRACHNRNYYQANKSLRQAQYHEWMQCNKDSLKRKWQIYRQLHRDERNATTRQWCRDNLHLGRARQARRRSAKLQATPYWSNLDAIKAIYREALIIQKVEGGQWHADHIVPLQGETVCGLHVPWNLQIIPASENIAKSNKLLSFAA